MIFRLSSVLKMIPTKCPFTEDVELQIMLAHCCQEQNTKIDENYQKIQKKSRNLTDMAQIGAS